MYKLKWYKQTYQRIRYRCFISASSFFLYYYTPQYSPTTQAISSGFYKENIDFIKFIKDGKLIENDKLRSTLQDLPDLYRFKRVKY